VRFPSSFCHLQKCRCKRNENCPCGYTSPSNSALGRASRYSSRPQRVQRRNLRDCSRLIKGIRRIGGSAGGKVGRGKEEGTRLPPLGPASSLKAVLHLPEGPNKHRRESRAS